MSHYYAVTDHGRTLVLAAGFGFGPRVAAQMLMRKLSMPPPTWLATITRQPPFSDLVARPFQTLINFGVVDPNLSRIPALNRVWIDCIAWTRHAVPDLVADYELLLGERFFAIPPVQEGQPQSIAVCPLLAQPPLQRKILSRVNSAPKLVVSFGGIATPFSTAVHHTHMPLALLGALAASKRSFVPRATLTSFLPPAFWEQCAGKAELAGLDLRLPDERAYRSAVEECDLLILQPGLYGPFEAFAVGIPVEFTFPMSYTQACQYSQYRKERILGCASDWAQVSPLLDCAFDLVEVDEPDWFDKSIRWWANTNNQMLSTDAICTWAGNVLRNLRDIDLELTERRRMVVQRACEPPRVWDLLANL